MADTDQIEQQRKHKRDLVKLARQLRDAGLDSLARVVLAATRSHPYSRTTSALAKPGLVFAAVARRRTHRLMGRLLSQLNMPSRRDLLALSTRLTHIEMSLDDLSAALDEMRAARPARAPGRRSAPRTAAVEGK